MRSLCLVLLLSLPNSRLFADEATVAFLLGAWELVDLPPVDIEESEPLGTPPFKACFFPQARYVQLEADEQMSPTSSTLRFLVENQRIYFCGLGTAWFEVDVRLEDPDTMVWQGPNMGPMTFHRLKGEAAHNQRLEPRSLQIVRTYNDDRQLGNLDVQYAVPEDRDFSLQRRVLGVWEIVAYRDTPRAMLTPYGGENKKMVFTEDGQLLVVGAEAVSLDGAQKMTYRFDQDSLVLNDQRGERRRQIRFNEWGHLLLDTNGSILELKLLQRESEPLPRLPRKIVLAELAGDDFVLEDATPDWRVPAEVSAEAWEQRLNAEDPQVRAEAAFAICTKEGIDRASILKKLTRMLRTDPSRAVRVEVTKALGELRDPSSLPALVELLSLEEDSSDVIADPLVMWEGDEILEAAAYAIGRYGPVAEPVLVQLTSTAAEGNPFAGDALQRIGSTAVSHLVAAFRQAAEVERRVRLVNILAGFGPAAEAAREPLAQAASSGPIELRFAAADALIEIHPPSAVGPLVGILEAGPDNDRSRVLSRLADLGRDATPAVPSLRAILEGDHDTYTREGSLAALAAIGPAARPAAPAVWQTGKAEPTLRRAMAATLVAMGPAAVPTLVGGLDDPEAAHRQGAALILGMLGREAETAIPALQKTFREEEHPAVKAALQRTLSGLGAAP